MSKIVLRPQIQRCWSVGLSELHAQLSNGLQPLLATTAGDMVGFALGHSAGVTGEYAEFFFSLESMGNSHTIDARILSMSDANWRRVDRIEARIQSDRMLSSQLAPAEYEPLAGFDTFHFSHFIARVVFSTSPDVPVAGLDLVIKPPTSMVEAEQRCSEIAALIDFLAEENAFFRRYDCIKPEPADLFGETQVQVVQFP